MPGCQGVGPRWTHPNPQPPSGVYLGVAHGSSVGRKSGKSSGCAFGRGPSSCPELWGVPRPPAPHGHRERTSKRAHTTHARRTLSEARVQLQATRRGPDKSLVSAKGHRSQGSEPGASQPVPGQGPSLHPPDPISPPDQMITCWPGGVPSLPWSLTSGQHANRHRVWGSPGLRAQSRGALAVPPQRDQHEPLEPPPIS